MEHKLLQLLWATFPVFYLQRYASGTRHRKPYKEDEKLYKKFKEKSGNGP